MNNNDSQLLPGTQNDDQNDPQTVTVSPTTTAPGHPMPSITVYPPMPVQSGTPNSNGLLMTHGMRFNFNRTGSPVTSPFKPLSQLYFRQVDLAMNLIAHGANQVPAAAAGPASYPQAHGFVTQGGGNAQPSTNLPPSNFSVDGAGTDISTGSSSNPSSIYNSKRIFFRGDKTSNKLVGTYLRTVPLPERRQVCRNIKTLYEDDFVSRLLIYTSKLDVHAASTSSLAEQPEGKFGSYAECKACYAEIKLSDEESFDTKEWELHSAECLAREEEEEEDV